MYAFLGLGGLIGSIVSLVFIVINAIKKKPKKNAVIALAICLVLFIVGLVLTPSSSNTADTGTKPESPAKVEEPTEPKASEAPAKAEEPLSFVLMDGQLGEYGVEVVLNKDTEFEEHEITYYLPAGTYLVENLNDKGAGQVSVFCGGPEKNGEWEEFIMDENCARPIVVMAGETKDLEVKEGQFIVLSDDTSNIKFTIK